MHQVPQARAGLKRWVGPALALGVFVFVASELLPDVIRQEGGFFGGPLERVEGVVLDPGRAEGIGRNRGTVRFYPRVRLADGREVVLATAFSGSAVPPVGETIRLRCRLTDAPVCRADRWLQMYFSSTLVIGITLLCLFGFGRRFVRSLRPAIPCADALRAALVRLIRHAVFRRVPAGPVHGR